MSVSSRIFEPGSLIEPTAGTVRRENGEAVGVWGDESNPVQLFVLGRDGSVRPANRAERRMADRIYPSLRRAR